jgi:hypothetical protein
MTPPPPPPFARSRALSESSLAKIFLFPSVLTMVLVALFPVLYALAQSLYEYDGRTRARFAGLGNYVDALTDPRLWRAVNATVVFTVSSVSLEFVIGLGCALFMHRAPRGGEPSGRWSLCPGRSQQRSPRKCGSSCSTLRPVSSIITSHWCPRPSIGSANVMCR